jgi:glycerol-3-phosphate dehydrogenase subunit C
MGPELTRFRLDNKIELEDEVDFCCNCRSCEQACPSGVKVSLLNAYYKSKWRESQGKQNLRDNLLGRPPLLARLGSFHVGATNFMLNKQLAKNVLEKTIATARERSFPQYHRESFSKWFSKRKIISANKKVVYFAGCFTNYNRPQVGKSVVKILEHHGYQVIVPEQNCCGLPLMANGLLNAAKQQGEKNIRSFKPYIEQGYSVISSCPSCTLTLKSEYEEMFALPGAKEFGQSVYDFSEFLLKLLVENQLDTSFKPLEFKLAYHTPCHLKAQGIGQPSLEMLRLIPHLQTIEIDQGCCGLSGSYGFKKEKYNISMEIGRKLFEQVGSINPDYITTDCGGCGLQLAHGTGRIVAHCAELIAQAYD